MDLNTARNRTEEDFQVFQSQPDKRSRTLFRREALNNWLSRRASAVPAIDDESTDAQGMASSIKNTGVVRVPERVIEFPREIKLQEWEGQVQFVGDRHFTARLLDITAGDDAETEEADFPVDDLTESDRSLLIPGAVFRWVIGHRYIRGQKERFARVIIRKLPIWTDTEIKAADKKADELFDELFPDCADRPTRT